MPSYACLCIPMHSYAFLCIPMHSHAFPCIPMNSHAFLCISMHFYAFICFLCFLCFMILMIFMLLCFLLFLYIFMLFSKFSNTKTRHNHPFYSVKQYGKPFFLMRYECSQATRTYTITNWPTDPLRVEELIPSKKCLGFMEECVPPEDELINEILCSIVF